jgi:hypothetical protein
MSGPFEMLGDPDAAVCEDGVCAVPGPRPEPQDADRPDESADARPGGVVPVQR